ncbi:hypothetical protein, variant [Capsaspora owczarzaki ATCC 30864]|uniref:UspA domain-containing protein n=1 Tax=Capsaspora owczarzaki (strain ATCC 30864) TaxID=595528 RepID=A0A0D2U489_CAPO3|nr:hypothetical protein, variant [Capsaspora owczarzaki ATCC 30864]
MPLESKQLSINADNNAPNEPQARTDSPQKKLWARSLIGELSAIDDNGAMPATDNSSAPASADTTESHGDLTATDSTTSYNLAEDLATNIARANNSKSSSSHPHQRELHSDSHSQRRARHSLDEQQRSAAMNYAETKSTPSSSVDNSTDTATQTPPSGILSSTSSAIVVALDDSAESQAAFEYVLDNLLAENDVLVLVHVYEPFSFVNMDVNEMGYVSSDIFDALSKEHKGIAKRVMQRYVAECNRRNVRTCMGGGIWW